MFRLRASWRISLVSSWSTGLLSGASSGMARSTTSAVVLVRDTGRADQEHLGQAAQQVGVQAVGKALGMLDRGGAHQLRAAQDVVTENLQGDGAQLGFLGAVDHIREVFAAPEHRRACGVVAAGVVGVLVAVLGSLVSISLDRANWRGWRCIPGWWGWAARPACRSCRTLRLRSAAVPVMPASLSYMRK